MAHVTITCIRYWDGTNVARVKNPSAALLLRALDSTDIRLLERLRYENDSSRRSVRGECDHVRKIIRVGISSHASTGGAADMVDSLIHELLHFVEPRAKESTVARWTKAHFTNPELRSRAAIKLLDLSAFGEG